MTNKQARGLLPPYLKWNKFLFYLVPIILLDLLMMFYAYGISITQKSHENYFWDQNVSYITIQVLYALVVISFIYPIFWAFKRKKTIKKIKLDNQNETYRSKNNFKGE
ncbi:hypothetical protein E1I18_00595 [Mycoplasmopsis mucosicanis]|uniref:Uncharacterized protein n=1 Tax=Mycoplasmopsis mucosicanis TaxID=458208 RepID=A0A507SQL9_9BACT|nr:hypothetical protein [Mycoplasmopsis mucosicanis]TQC54089.1 hypothetical protein E1I18_00595 [Mycoplasmopsis mucosicanis]